MSNFYEQSDSKRFARFTQSTQKDWDIPGITRGVTMEEYDSMQANYHLRRYRMEKLHTYLQTSRRCDCRD